MGSDGECLSGDQVMSRKILFASLVVMFLLLPGAAYVLNPAVDQEFHELYDDNLNQIKPLSKQLALNILQAHRGYVLHYDYIEADLNRLEKSLNLARLTPAFVNEAFKGERDTILTQYQLRLRNIRNDVNNIKSLIGLVRNSEKRSDAISRQIGSFSPDSAIVEGLFMYQQMLNAGAAADVVQDHLEKLQGLESQFSAQLSSLTPHALVLSRFRPVLVDLMTETNSTLLKADLSRALLIAYRNQHGEATKKINYFLLLVSIVGAALLLLSTSLMLVHSRYRQTQIENTLAKNAELTKALKERDEFSEQASIDSLTGILNRRAFKERCNELLMQTVNNRVFALFVMDVDKFKSINDEHGHSAGDTVLQMIPVRLRQVLDDSDVMGRLGGDEFAVLVGASTREELQERAVRVYNNLRMSLMQNGISIDVSVSLGAVEVDYSAPLADLLSDADIAMYSGRKSGIGETVWYQHAMREEAENFKRLSCDLAKALDCGEIRQTYQPIVDMASGDITSLEVLARWNHPTRGVVSPEIFIDVAQRSSLIRKLDNVMLESSLDVLRELHKNNHMFIMQVNMSNLSFTKELPKYVMGLLRERQIEPRYLTLELNETWIVNDVEGSAAVMEELVENGISLHLDDFGTGYSSLTHLESFPASGLKIDRAFISQIMEKEKSKRSVEATLSLAKLHHLDVVAKGIETEAQAQYLKNLGCPFGQGYYFARPMEFPQLMKMLSVGCDKAA